MMTDREKLLALVWRRMPTELKVTASDMRFVSVAGKLTRLDSMSDSQLFTTLRRASAVKMVLKYAEAA